MLYICAVHSLAPLTDYPCLVNNKKNLTIKYQESVDGSLQTKNFIEICNRNKTKLTKIPYTFFFSSSKCVRIARLVMQQNPVIKVIKESKENHTFFLIALQGVIQKNMGTSVFLRDKK